MIASKPVTRAFLIGPRWMSNALRAGNRWILFLRSSISKQICEFGQSNDAVHPRRKVVTGGDNTLAVGREHRAINIVGVTLQGGQQSPAGRVPHPRRFVYAGRNDALTVRRKRCVLDTRRVTFERGHYHLARLELTDKKLELLCHLKDIRF